MNGENTESAEGEKEPAPDVVGVSGSGLSPSRPSSRFRISAPAAVKTRRS